MSVVNTKWQNVQERSNLTQILRTIARRNREGEEEQGLRSREKRKVKSLYSGKESPWRCKRCRFDPWVGKMPWSRKWQPSQVFLPRKFHGQRSLVGYSTWGYKDSEVSEHTGTKSIIIQWISKIENPEELRSHMVVVNSTDFLLATCIPDFQATGTQKPHRCVVFFFFLITHRSKNAIPFTQHLPSLAQGPPKAQSSTTQNFSKITTVFHPKSTEKNR